MDDAAKHKYVELEKQAKEQYNKEKAEFDKTAAPRTNAKGTHKKSRPKTDENKPKRAWPPFFFFQQDRRDGLKKENPDKNHKDIVSMLGEEWRNLSAEQKQPYVDKSAVDQKRYEQEKKASKQGKRALPTAAVRLSLRSRSLSGGSGLSRICRSCGGRCPVRRGRARLRVAPRILTPGIGKDDKAEAKPVKKSPKADKQAKPTESGKKRKAAPKKTAKPAGAKRQKGGKGDDAEQPDEESAEPKAASHDEDEPSEQPDSKDGQPEEEHKLAAGSNHADSDAEGDLQEEAGNPDDEKDPESEDEPKDDEDEDYDGKLLFINNLNNLI